MIGRTDTRRRKKLKPGNDDFHDTCFGIQKEFLAAITKCDIFLC